VLELGLLPMLMRSPFAPGDAEAAEEFAIGALAAYGREPMEDLLPCARGSDNLQMRQVRVVGSEHPNLPVVDGEPAYPQAFADEILAGFEACHATLRTPRWQRRREQTLQGWRDTPVRLLARPTMDYTALLARSLSPEPLRSTAARAALVESDLRYLGEARLDAIGDLVAAEHESLMATDIPRFEVLAGDGTGAGTVLYQDPIHSAAERWEALDDDDLVLQRAIVRERVSTDDASAMAERTTDRADLLAHASDIVGSLVRCAHTGRDPGWVYAAMAPGLGAAMVHADREALYEGAAGTAVAVAEVGRLVAQPAWCEVAARVFDPLRRGEPPVSAQRGGGMARGIGGLIYALVRVSDATGDDALADLAIKVACERGPAIAEHDRLDEVLYGSAGLLLSLLALHRRRPDERVLAVADLAARKIMRRAHRTSNGAWWGESLEAALPHVSHGTAGIALALARWSALRHNAEAADLARAAMSFDDTFWTPDDHGWRDARLDGTLQASRTSWAWCNGRAGAVLARVAVAEALGESGDDHLLLDACGAPPADVLMNVSPGMCCGTPGAVDALLAVSGRAPGDVEQLARGAIERLATSSPRSHYWTLSGSLFTGCAGLAFALARAAQPDAVEALLSFD
jgi:lantibiotic modifying enzyme